MSILKLFRKNYCVCGKEVQKPDSFCPDCLKKIKEAIRQTKTEAIRKGKETEHMSDMVKNYIIYALARSESDWNYELTDTELETLVQDLLGDCCQIVFNKVHIWATKRGFIKNEPI